MTVVTLFDHMVNLRHECPILSQLQVRSFAVAFSLSIILGIPDIVVSLLKGFVPELM